MKIKNIYLKRFRAYQEWNFTPRETGIHLIYGANESGKTTLLEGFRSLLFGWLPKDRKESSGAIDFWHDSKEYHMSRDGKKLTLFRLGEQVLIGEPSALWWHGLDRKTYERIFGLTLQDMAGVGIINDVDVRTRFFGAEGSERLGDTVKAIEKTTADLLVASANGKRKINVLVEQLRQNKQYIEELQGHEQEYVVMRQRIEDTWKNEEELQASLYQWKEYYKSVELVLQAWETYKRSEEAQVQMKQLMQGTLPDQERFLALDQEINQCREHMRIWRGKEEGLLPENFSPDAPIGLYSREIEALYEQLARWEQLQKECAQGQDFLDKMADQLTLSHKMHTTWREDEPMPEQVDWFEGERIAQSLRNVQSAYEQWRAREPIVPENYDVSIVEAIDDEVAQEAIQRDEKGIEQMHLAFLEKERAEKELFSMSTKAPNTMLYNIVGVVMAICTIVIYMLSKGHLNISYLLGMALTSLVGGLCIAFAIIKNSQFDTRRKKAKIQIDELEKQLLAIAKEYDLQVPKSVIELNKLKKVLDERRKVIYSRDVEKVKQFAYYKQREAWTQEGQQLEQTIHSEQAKWVKWLPKGANATCNVENFFGMKQEYDTYMELKQTYEGYVETLRVHKEELAAIEDTAAQLWKKLLITDVPTTVGLRQLYRTLQNYQQNQIRWEQKEAQRRTYREEYDNWHCKEKDLLLQQAEILQKSGFQSATEFRRKLISVEQYGQWDTIYKQSRVQLKLLAPDQDTYDLLMRRLKEGNCSRWEEEVRHGQEQMESLERKLAQVHELRGELSETMRRLGSDQELARAIQRRSQLENELRQFLEEWATQIYIGYFIELAQQEYETEKQPQVMDVASQNLQVLTEGKYSMSAHGVDGTIVLHDVAGTLVPSHAWSSGLADQVYLAIRLSLAVRFGQQVEPMPIILDDIFVRFDEQRQKAALALLVTLAEQEQIFIFTCQEQLMRLAKELNSEYINMYAFTAHSQIGHYE